MALRSLTIFIFYQTTTECKLNTLIIAAKETALNTGKLEFDFFEINKNWAPGCIIIKKGFEEWPHYLYFFVC